MKASQCPALEEMRAATEGRRSSSPVASRATGVQQHGSMSAPEPRVTAQAKTCYFLRARPNQTMKPLESGSGESTLENAIRQDVPSDRLSLSGDFQSKLLETSVRGVRKVSPHFATHRISAARREHSEPTQKTVELCRPTSLPTSVPTTPRQPLHNVPSQQSQEMPEAKALAPSARAILGNVQMGAPPPMSAGSVRFSSTMQSSKSQSCIGGITSNSNDRDGASPRLVSAELNSGKMNPRTVEAPMQAGPRHRSLALQADPKIAVQVRVGAEGSMGSHIRLSSPTSWRETDVLTAVPHS